MPSPNDFSISTSKRERFLFSNKDNLIDQESKIYFQPKIRNCEAVDSFILPDKRYQITVSLDHSVSMKGLEHALRQMNIMSGEFELYFVVPSDIFERFAYQRILPCQAEHPRLAKAFSKRACKQFAIEISLTRRTADMIQFE